MSAGTFIGILSICAMPRHLNCYQPELINLEILFFAVACDITNCLLTSAQSQTLILSRLNSRRFYFIL